MAMCIQRKFIHHAWLLFVSRVHILHSIERVSKHIQVHEIFKGNLELTDLTAVYVCCYLCIFTVVHRNCIWIATAYN